MYKPGTELIILKVQKLLENSVIKLRAPEPEDLELLYTWENSTELWELGATIAPFSRHTLRQYLANNTQDIYTDKQLRLMIEFKQTGKGIGTVDLYDFDPFHLRAGVGILIDPGYRNQGLGLQALLVLESYAFSFLNLHQLYAVIPEKNSPSIRLFQKAEYVSAGLLSDWLSAGETYVDALLFQKIRGLKLPDS